MRLAKASEKCLFIEKKKMENLLNGMGVDNSIIHSD